jgi:hypothetical protein
MHHLHSDFGFYFVARLVYFFVDATFFHGRVTLLIHIISEKLHLIFVEIWELSYQVIHVLSCSSLVLLQKIELIGSLKPINLCILCRLCKSFRSHGDNWTALVVLLN